MASLEPAERLALIRENLEEVLNEEIIEKIIAEGRHPKIYWGESPAILGHCLSPRSPGTEADGPIHGSNRHGDDGKAALRLLCPQHQDRPVPLRRLRRHHPPRRHPRLPRQPQGPDRARRAARPILREGHWRDLQVGWRADREAALCAGQLLPEERRVCHGRLQAGVLDLGARREAVGALCANSARRC